MKEKQYEVLDEVIMSVIFTIKICDVPIEVCCIHEACKNIWNPMGWQAPSFNEYIGASQENCHD